MRSLIVAFCMLGTAIPANAILHKAASTRIAASGMTCAQVQEIIRKKGMVVITWRSNSSPSHRLHHRFVDGAHYCTNPEVLTPVSIPTADTKSCRVVYCFHPYR